MLPYVPALRTKPGELAAVARLAPDIQSQVCPRWIVVPPKEYDPELQRVPTLDEIARLTGRNIGRKWPLRPAFLDPLFVTNELGPDGLREMFRIAQGINPSIIPISTPDELNSSLSAVFSNILAQGKTKLCLRVDFDKFDKAAIHEGLRAAGITYEDCNIIADFAGADLTPNLATGAIRALLEDMNDLGRWQKIIFQGSNFPAKNPAEPNNKKLISRDEWLAWNAAINVCEVPEGQLSYGDYGADSSEIKFYKKGGGRPIRHLRYTTPTHTVIVRSSDGGKNKDAMRDVCKKLLKSGYFERQSFSIADDRIYRIANNHEDVGQPSDWREINTIHHITRVVRDIGIMRGITFAETPATGLAKQELLFEEE